MLTTEFIEAGAAATWIGGIALGTSLGPIGPVTVGAGIAVTTLIPATALALMTRRPIKKGWLVKK